MERVFGEVHALNRHMLWVLAALGAIIVVLTALATWHSNAIRDEFTREHEENHAELAAVIQNQRVIMTNQQRMLELLHDRADADDEDGGI